MNNYLNNNVISSVSNPLIDNEGRFYKSLSALANELKVSRKKITKIIKEKGYFNFDDKTYTLISSGLSGTIYGLSGDVRNDDQLNGVPKSEFSAGTKVLEVEKPIEYEEDYKTFLKAKEVEETPFKSYEIKFQKKNNGVRYAIALFSDAHIEETVKPETVCFMNEYNIDIARQRIQTYFNNLAICINRDAVEELVFASLGDTISGYIHEELAQTNSMTPLEATFEAQSLIYSGLKFICENTGLKKITFVGIVGNHSRTTKKIQHNNGIKLSYEWLMYQNIKKECEITNLPIDFILPDSEIAKVDMSDGKRFLFMHGFQVKSGGGSTVCGVYPALNRYTMRCDKNFKQDKVYMGHYHTCISIPNATVNGSIIGMTSYSFSNGFAYERPAQMFEVYDTSIGLINTRQIYCD